MTERQLGPFHVEKKPILQIDTLSTGQPIEASVKDKSHSVTAWMRQNPPRTKDQSKEQLYISMPGLQLKFNLTLIPSLSPLLFFPISIRMVNARVRIGESVQTNACSSEKRITDRRALTQHLWFGTCIVTGGCVETFQYQNKGANLVILMKLGIRKNSSRTRSELTANRLI